MTAALIETPDPLSRELAGKVKSLEDQINKYSLANRTSENYYFGAHTAQSLGISDPPRIRWLETVVGWPGTAVDSLEERLDFLGWDSPASSALEQVYEQNALDVESSMAHIDALMYGVSFIRVGKGERGEPDVLITAESPKTTTGEWSRRKRKLEIGLSLAADPMGGDLLQGTLMTEESMYELYRRSPDSPWTVVRRYDTPFRQVPMVLIANRPSASAPGGRSEITKPVRGYTDMAARTLKGMEIHREFYQAPQRYILGVSEEEMEQSKDDPNAGWQAIMGRLLTFTRDEEGMLPEVGTFQPASPQPYLEQVKGIAQLLAAELGIPTSYLGFHTENPSSADAIRQAEARHVKRAERRQSNFSRPWNDVGRLSLAYMGEDESELHASWRDAGTPTRAAAADEAVKLIGAGVLQPQSKITYDRIGLTPREQKYLERENRRLAGRAALAGLQQEVANRLGNEGEEESEETEEE